ncbi:FG-GAP repeat protein [Streptomyces lutosisoli]|uniref:FG-GAP repeat protein n=1 Tax=Streptomyces lutosisoli TaxID=2665721 RepID=A0ABW2VE95_9ACTN
MSRRTVISRATSGILGSPVKGQAFGAQLSKGELDGDGYADLVVGTAGAGDAVVVWGGPHGLSGGTSVPAENTQVDDVDGVFDLALFRPDRAPGDDPVGATAALWTGPVSRTGTLARTSALDPGHLPYVDVHGGDVRLWHTVGPSGPRKARTLTGRNDTVPGADDENGGSEGRPFSFRVRPWRR